MSLKQGMVWMPYTQMKGASPILIERGEGVWLYTKEGKGIIDAISSWWVNLHGHARPEIAEALYAQAQKLEQVISAGYSHDPAQQLAEKVLHTYSPQKEAPPLKVTTICVTIAVHETSLHCCKSPRDP